jgi:hypothetical protein
MPGRPSCIGNCSRFVIFDSEIRGFCHTNNTGLPLPLKWKKGNRWGMAWPSSLSTRGVPIYMHGNRRRPDVLVTCIFGSVSEFWHHPLWAPGQLFGRRKPDNRPARPRLRTKSVGVDPAAPDDPDDSAGPSCRSGKKSAGPGSLV